MTDITMCKGDDCPKKETCYRYMAIPNEYRQAYFMTIPYHNDDCNHFYPIEGRPCQKKKE